MGNASALMVSPQGRDTRPRPSSFTLPNVKWGAKGRFSGSQPSGSNPASRVFFRATGLPVCHPQTVPDGSAATSDWEKPPQVGGLQGEGGVRRATFSTACTSRTLSGGVSPKNTNVRCILSASTHFTTRGGTCWAKARE